MNKNDIRNRELFESELKALLYRYSHIENDITPLVLYICFKNGLRYRLTINKLHMNLTERLQSLREGHLNEKVKAITSKLEAAAAKGESKANFTHHFYDEEVIKYLRAQGLKVHHVNDFRDGDFISVEW